MNTTTAAATTTKPTAEEKAEFCKMLREMMDNWDTIRTAARQITSDEEQVYQMTRSAFEKSLGLDKYLAR